MAQRTIEFDHQINRLEVETDELCLRILAKRQPVASDLRFITMALKLVTDLERIGVAVRRIADEGLVQRHRDAMGATASHDRRGGHLRGHGHHLSSFGRLIIVDRL